MGWIAELLLQAVLVFAGAVLLAAAAIWLVLAGWNLLGVLLWRWRCHGSLAHPARAHAGTDLADRYAQQVPPLWRMLLRWPPIPLRRRP